MYLDAKGLPEQQDGDGGDKLQRVGFWWEGMDVANHFPFVSGMASYPESLEALTDANGNLLRDWVKYTDPKDISRDQMIPNIRCCGFYERYGGKDRLDRILLNLLKNFSRYPNKDFAFLTDYACFVRSYSAWYLYPFLLIADAYLVLSTIFTVVLGLFDRTGWFWRKDKFVGDDLNLIGTLSQAKEVLPTIFSFLARKIFRHFRPGGCMYGMVVYFDPSTGANTEFIDLWKPTVEDF